MAHRLEIAEFWCARGLPHVPGAAQKCWNLCRLGEWIWKDQRVARRFDLGMRFEVLHGLNDFSILPLRNRWGIWNSDAT
jgi:hypothetical protein